MAQFCIRCGTPIDEKDRFCTNCGAQAHCSENEREQHDTSTAFDMAQPLKADVTTSLDKTQSTIPIESTHDLTGNSFAKESYSRQAFDGTRGSSIADTHYPFSSENFYQSPYQAQAFPLTQPKASPKRKGNKAIGIVGGVAAAIILVSIGVVLGAFAFVPSDDTKSSDESEGPTSTFPEKSPPDTLSDAKAGTSIEQTPTVPPVQKPINPQSREQSASQENPPSTPQPSANPNEQSQPVTPSQSEDAMLSSKYAGDKKPFWGVFADASHSEENIQQMAQAARGKGFSPRIIITNDWSNLNPEHWFSITLGTFNNEAEADMSRAVSRAIIGQAPLV